MISDPEIYDLVDFREPGLILNGATELLTGGLGFTVLRQIDSLPVGPFVDPFYDTLMLYTSIVNVDLNLPNESIVRLSSLINQKNIGLDFAANINAGKISLDAELFSTVKSLDSAKPSGGYLGLLCQVTDRFGIAARADALAADGLTKMGMRYGLGATFDIKDGIFFSIEYGRLVPYKETVSNEIGFEFGLERRISLPGFQRKNLSRD
jgi:hypothetical protein